VNRISAPSDLTIDEITLLRLIVTRSFMSKRSISSARYARLLERGLVQSGMGGIMPTPAGQMAAHMKV
jgi:hypothetical protein